jgi:hypothetical protein
VLVIHTLATRRRTTRARLTRPRLTRPRIAWASLARNSIRRDGFVLPDRGGGGLTSSGDFTGVGNFRHGSLALVVGRSVPRRGDGARSRGIDHVARCRVLRRLMLRWVGYARVAIGPSSDRACLRADRFGPSRGGGGCTDLRVGIDIHHPGLDQLRAPVLSLGLPLGRFRTCARSGRPCSGRCCGVRRSMLLVARIPWGRLRVRNLIRGWLVNRPFGTQPLRQGPGEPDGLRVAREPSHLRSGALLYERRVPDRPFTHLCSSGLGAPAPESSTRPAGCGPLTGSINSRRPTSRTRPRRGPLVGGAGST